MQIEKKDIRALTKEQLRNFFVSNGDKAFRGNQVYEWLWQKRAHTFEDMTNVSKETRAMLEANFVINHIKVDTLQRSEDGTVKNAVRLHDDLIVESVLIPFCWRRTSADLLFGLVLQENQNERFSVVPSFPTKRKDDFECC